MRYLNTQRAPTKVRFLPQKEGKMCIYIGKLGKGGREKISSKWAVSETLIG